MESIIKQASEIIKEAGKDERKEACYKEFAFMFSLSGILSTMGDPLKCTDTLLDFLNTFKQSMTKKGYSIRGVEKELESKFLLIHLGTMMNAFDVKTQQDMDKALRNEFDDLIWGKCIFDGGQS